MSKMPKYHPNPPKLATCLLRWYCRKDLVDEVEGDLYELFQRRVEEQGDWKAKLLYWLNVLMFLHPDYIRKKETYTINHTDMFGNYFKIGWRNISKHKGYSFINTGGLTVGMTVTLLIGLWVYDELSFYQYHAKSMEKGFSTKHLAKVTPPTLPTLSGVKSYWFNQDLLDQKQMVVYLHGGCAGHYQLVSCHAKSLGNSRLC